MTNKDAPPDQAANHDDNMPRPGKYLTFFLRGEKYGLAIETVKEIIRMQKIRPVPYFPSHLKGVISLRGSILALMDLRIRFNMEETEYTDRTCVIVTTLNGKELGLIVDTVADVTVFGAQDLEPQPALSRSETSDFVEGIGKTAEDVIIILNMVKLLSDEDLHLV